MTAVPLGQGAYKRLYAGAPEVKLLNRFLESNPANPREGSSILARPGTTQLTTLSAGSFAGTNIMRGNFSLSGLFNNALFVVCGTNLYYIDTNMNASQITGTLTGTGTPEVAWQVGSGYQRLWIADGNLLYYVNGGNVATGALTYTGAAATVGDKIQIGSVYYQCGNTFSSSDAGTSANPYIVRATSGLTASSLMYYAITATGTPGSDYSSTLTSPHPQVTATLAGDPGIISLTSRLPGSVGNSIATVVLSGTIMSFGSSTLTGGSASLVQVNMPSNQPALSLTQVSGYVLVSVANSQVFYWINPGDTSIDALNFASKESSADSIISMRTVGDQVLIMGSKSTENWYATGNSAEPFAPIEGRVYARGVVPNTPVVVDDAVIVVGDDGRVYSIGFQAGDSVNVGWGVSRISNNGIEERIRRQIRREAGLTP